MSLCFPATAADARFTIRAIEQALIQRRAVQTVKVLW